MKIQIKGIEWTIRRFSDKKFSKLHSNHDRAVTIYYPVKEIHFNHSDFNKSVILHELAHAYYNSCLTGDSELKTDQIEEVFAKILEKHYYELGRLCNQIYRKFKKKKIKKKIEYILATSSNVEIKDI